MYPNSLPFTVSKDMETIIPQVIEEKLFFMRPAFDPLETFEYFNNRNYEILFDSSDYTIWVNYSNEEYAIVSKKDFCVFYTDSKRLKRLDEMSL